MHIYHVLLQTYSSSTEYRKCLRLLMNAYFKKAVLWSESGHHEAHDELWLILAIKSNFTARVLANKIYRILEDLLITVRIDYVMFARRPPRCKEKECKNEWNECNCLE